MFDQLSDHFFSQLLVVDQWCWLAILLLLLFVLLDRRIDIALYILVRGSNLNLETRRETLLGDVEVFNFCILPTAEKKADLLSFCSRKQGPEHFQRCFLAWLVTFIQRVNHNANIIKAANQQLKRCLEIIEGQVLFL